MEQATEKQVPRSLRPLYALLRSSFSFSFSLQIFLHPNLQIKIAVSVVWDFVYLVGVYKPMEFWQLEDQTPQSTKRRHGSSVFTLKEMEEATCSFSEKNLVGKGGFGRVYRGVLRSGEVLLLKRKFHHDPRKKTNWYGQEMVVSEHKSWSEWHLG